MSKKTEIEKLDEMNEKACDDIIARQNQRFTCEECQEVFFSHLEIQSRYTGKLCHQCAIDKWD